MHERKLVFFCHVAKSSKAKTVYCMSLFGWWTVSKPESAEVLDLEAPGADNVKALDRISISPLFGCFSGV